MTRSKRNRKAKNRIDGSLQEPLIEADPSTESAVPAVVHRSVALAVVRKSEFTAEFEEVIEIIAKDRVYRAMLDRLSRLLTAP